ncbi:MAG: hypothetical protein JST36_00835 [Bacteroidetes bacterium]|nr:hypothetical protein [Bacteroidota bacterium]
MKKLIFPLLLLLPMSLVANAQEGTAELSKAARKGFLTETGINDGNYSLVYKIAGDKKHKDELSYERYIFDKELKFVKSEQTQEPKVPASERPDRTINRIVAGVGGCNSFNVLSMKLNFTKSSILQKWNEKKQRYVTEKVLSSETFKPKSDFGTLTGNATFNSPDDGTLFVLAGGKSDKDKRATQFVVLTSTADGDIDQKPIDLSGSQTLVYAQQLQAGDIVLVFAPDKGSPDLSAYTYFRYAPNGSMKHKISFKSPSPNMLVTGAVEDGNSVLLCGTSTKKDDAYNDIFAEFAGEISNPCFDGAENFQDQKWEKRADAKMANFHLVKFTGDHFDFASTEPIASFKEKLKPAAGEKHVDAYDGKKFSIENFTVTPQGEYLVAGQLTGRKKLGTSTAVKSYEDLVCFHFDKDGHLKAQYATNKMNGDKKSEIFPVVQQFKASKDGKSVYWIVMEVKGFKGYASFYDAYNGNETYYPRYFPRISKIDPAGLNAAAFKVLGNEDYYVSKDFAPLENTADNSLVYIGCDEDNNTIWLGKYIFE